MSEMTDKRAIDASNLKYTNAVTGSPAHKREYRQIFWMNVDSHRVLRNLSQTALAKEIGLLPASFNSAHQRKSILSFEQCGRLASVLGCTLDDLFSRERYEFNKELDKKNAETNGALYMSQFAAIRKNEATLLDEAYERIGAEDELTKNLIQDFVLLPKKDKILLGEILKWREGGALSGELEEFE